MEIVESGIVNPAAAGHPATATRAGLAVIGKDRLVASYRIGSTKDCDDETVELRWSEDAGRSWSEPSAPFASEVGGVRGTLALVHLTSLGGLRLIAAGLWINREAFPGKPLFNAETEGCLPMAVLVTDSADAGRTWTAWRVVPMPEDIGPPSLTNPILRFPDGTLALSVETNKNYLDRSPWHQRVVHLRSSDHGRSWSRPETVSEDPSHRIFYWDQRGAVLANGDLVTFSWTYDRQTNSYLNVHRNLSRDQGRSWRGFEDLGFSDQPSHPAVLPDGRLVLAWVDRFRTASIRARAAAGADAPFPESSEVVLYAHGNRTTAGEGTGELLAEMGLWSFGLPYAVALPGGEALIVYYAGTTERISLHWARVRV